MTKKLFKNLLLTFVLSLFLTGLMFTVWYGSKQRGFEEGQALTLLFLFGNIFQNLLLTLAALPAFFLTMKNNYTNRQKRLIFYFGGPILLTLMFVLFVGKSWFDKFGFLLPGISFIGIHSYFYMQLLSVDKQHSN